MTRTRLAAGAAVLAAALAVTAYAQTPAPAPAPAPAAQPANPPADQPSTMDKVRSWSQKKWNAAKKEMSKDKAKWDACNAQAKEHKLDLTSRAGWAFIYDCMKKPT